MFLNMITSVFVAVFIAIAIVGVLIHKQHTTSKVKEEVPNKLSEESQPIVELSSKAVEQTIPAISKTGAEILTDFLTQTGCVVEECETRDEWT